VNEVGIAESGVGVGDAGPGCAVAKLRLRDGPQRFSVADGVFRWRARRSERSRHDNLRADLESVGITKAGIECKEFLPAVPIAKAGGGKLPERVAGFDRDDRQLTGACR